MDGLVKRFGPDVLADYVIAKMTEATRAKKPFFILHNELLPHWPLVKTPQDRSLNRKASMGNMIEYMDMLVGRVLNAINELGVRDNTYVFFMGDNGLQVSYRNNALYKNSRFGQPGEKEHTRHTIKGNVDGAKSDLNDAGSHVPFIAWGPKSIPAGGVNEELVDVVDLFETFCELTATNHIVETDGRSIVNQIHGKDGPPRQWVHQGLPQGESIFDGQWRYLLQSGQLIDARELPKERELKGAEKTKHKHIIDRMKSLYSRITSNGPAPPKTMPW
jgi:arylsulfatase A-like enzyme